MKERRFRNKITWFSFFFTLLVVWIHAANAELFLGADPAASLTFDIEEFLAEDIGQMAVPGFFMISGYLFFRHFNLGELEGKWERRIRSTLIPYILWNFLYYLGYVAASRLPVLSSVVGKGTVSLSLGELVSAVLRFKYNPVFWYMFQLILLILLAPVIYLFIRDLRGRVILFAALGILLVFNIYLPFLNTDALFYYSLAGALALNKRTQAVCEAENVTWKRSATGILAILCAILFYWAAVRFIAPVGFVLCRTLVVAGLWLMVPAVALPKAGEVVSEHFFLYATHFALVRLINKGVAMLLPQALHVAAVPLILFLAMPFLTLAISSFIYGLLHRYLPRICLLLNGDRK